MPRFALATLRHRNSGGEILTAMRIGGRPSGRITAAIGGGLSQRPGADGRQSGGLEQGEHSRRGQSVSEILPAKQRLHSCNGTGAQRELQLIMEYELILIECRTQPVLRTDAPREF